MKPSGSVNNSTAPDPWDAPGVRRSDVHLGDVVVVKTRNSVYTLRSIGDNKFAVSGGWFRQTSDSSVPISVVGCTLGGTAVKHDVIAACGMHIEFCRRVTTSKVLSICHFRSSHLN